MHPELFELPFVHVTVKSYGVMMVVGFLAAIFVMWRMVRRLGENPQRITDLALYALVAGVIGARIFHIIHHHGEYDTLLSLFAVWRGGLEYLGGVIAAVAVILIYLFYNKLPVRSYLDVLSMGLMLGLMFGRIGCIFAGCCYGKPTDSIVGIRFPYGAPAYYNQVYPDAERNRSEPLMDLPPSYFYFPGYTGQGGQAWYPASEENKETAYLKPPEMLTPEQREAVTEGAYRCMPVHPTQIYSSLNALAIFAVLYAFWRKFGLRKPGTTFSLALILYGLTRLYLEALRNDNPFEYAWWTIYPGGTISQNLGIYLAILGAILMVVFIRRQAKVEQQSASTGVAARAHK